MHHRLRKARAGRSVAGCTVALLACLSAPGEGLAQEPCATFVHLQDGRFMEGNVPYAMEGPNLLMSIAGTENGPGVDPPWEYFLAPYYATQPDGQSVCNGPPPAGTLCCADEPSCLADLEFDVDGIGSFGSNSVRLVPPRMEWDASDPDHAIPYFRCSTASAGAANSSTCKMDLMDPDVRERALTLIENQINLLGDHGIRTVLLTGHPDGGSKRARMEYGKWLEDLGQRLANNPYLIAYDPMNEPLYFFDAAASELDCLEPDEQLDRCKDLAIAASKDWFDHLTLHDQNHLVSIGLGDQGSVFMWDPAVVKDHFTSYHVYPNPGGPWDDPGPGGVAGPGGIIPFTAPPPVSGGDYVANDIYFGSLNACGTPCPYVGEYDGANCLVATGPVGSSGFIDEGEFNYQHFTSGPPCTAGTNTGVACNLASYDPGRDTPFLLNQPLYYVVADPTATLPQDRCPPGTTYDGANCLVHTGPPGAQPFLWTEPSTGSTGYYYNWLPGPQHCQPPAVDDTAHCYLGPVPTGWDPFYMTRPLYYVTAVACGTKKPVYMGETGFTVYPYPTGAADFWDSVSWPTGITGLDTVKQACDRVEGGPEIDFLSVAGEVLEAENGGLSGNTAYVSCPGNCSQGGAIKMVAGSQIDLFPNGDTGACAELTIKYRSNRETRIWVAAEGMAPRRVKLPGTNSIFTVTSLQVPLPASTTAIVISAPHDNANGDAVQQAEYLLGDGGSWPGLWPYSQSCGFQGLHYWSYGSLTKWGGCADQAMNAPWYHIDQASPPPGTEAFNLRPTAAGDALRDQVSYFAPSADKCAEPPNFRAARNRELSANPVYHYEGVVTDGGGVPLANAPVRITSTDCNGTWMTPLITYTDRNGEYQADTDFPVVKVEGSYFGHRTKYKWVGPPPSLPTLELPVMDGIQAPPAPTPPLMACRGPDGWVPQ